LFINVTFQSRQQAEAPGRRHREGEDAESRLNFDWLTVSEKLLRKEPGIPTSSAVPPDLYTGGSMLGLLLLAQHSTLSPSYHAK